MEKVLLQVIVEDRGAYMKRIKRILFILVIALLCSGCTVKYNLEIKESEIIENIIVNDTFIEGRTSSDILNDYNSWMPVYDNIDNPDLIRDSDDEGGKIDGIEYHEKNITNINNGYYHTYKYTYPINRFSHANSLKLAFGKPIVYDGGSYLNLRTDNQNVLCNYDYFESLQVNIKVDLDKYTVSNHNAHRVSGSTYTWNLNRNNCNNSIISLTLNKKSNNTSAITTTKRNNEVDKNNKGLDNYVLYIFLGVMVLVIIFGYRWFMNMKERDNGVDD